MNAADSCACQVLQSLAEREDELLDRLSSRPPPANARRPAPAPPDVLVEPLTSTFVNFFALDPRAKLA